MVSDISSFAPESLEIEQLCMEFVRTEGQREAAFRRLGKLYFWICVKLEVDPSSRGYKNGVYVVLMEKGATKDGCGHAAMAAKVYAKVQAGEITEFEYERFTYLQMKDIVRGEAPRPAFQQRSRARRETTSRTSKDADTYDALPEFLEAPEAGPENSLDPLREALKDAQNALLRARAAIKAEMPDAWDELIGKALSPIGRLRFEVNEFSTA